MIDHLRRAAVDRFGLESTYRRETKLRRGVAGATWRLRRIRQPILIWGPGRSGSYLLYDLLAQHPAVGCPRVLRRPARGVYGDQHYGPSALAHLARSPYPPVEGARRLVLRRYPQLDEQTMADPEVIAVVRREFRRAFAQYPMARRYLDKAPPYTFLLPLLERCLPEARHVYAVRDPLAVYQSHVRRLSEPGALTAQGWWGYPVPGWEQYADRPIAERAAWIVLEHFRVGNEERERLGDRCTTCRYEDLCADPRGELRRVALRVDLDPRGLPLDQLPERLEDYNPPPDGQVLDDLPDALADGLRALQSAYDARSEVS